jgi:putative RecB family exonuclease
MTEEQRTHRSVSQIKQYERCPYAYYLDRVEKVWSRPAAWLAQGTAVHAAAEFWEKTGRTGALDDVLDVFDSVYQKEIEESLEVAPMAEWFGSGPYGPETDIERRYGIGRDQVYKYLDYYFTVPDEVIWVSPDGEPGIEIGFDIDLDGILVRGYIDTVINTPYGVLVRDIKTGNLPGDDFQLAVYGVALTEQFGVEMPDTGDYWMGKSGKPTKPYDLTMWGRGRVSEAFAMLEDSVTRGLFPPKPGSNCRVCSVSHACRFAV